MEHIYIHQYGTDKMFHGIIDSKKIKASTYCKKHGFEPNLCRIMVLSQAIELVEITE